MTSESLAHKLLEEFDHRHAGHCESGTVATLLRSNGLDLSEPMVFGIGGGLFFFYMPLVKMAGMPLTAYRDAPRILLKNTAKRLGVRYRYLRFRDPQKGMDTLDDLLQQGTAVGLQGNVFWLSYFPPEMRFQYNGHNFVAIGKRDGEYIISDPVADHIVSCPAEDLRRARFAKGLMAPKGLIYYPEYVPENPPIAEVIPVAIKDTAKRMLDIPVPFFGVRGIRFLANRMERWPHKKDQRTAAALVGHVVRMQEEIGTGGAGFRFMYAAFLKESANMLGNDKLRQASEMLSDTGDRWREFAMHGAALCQGSDSGDSAYKNLAGIIRECADREEKVYYLMREAVS